MPRNSPATETPSPGFPPGFCFSAAATFVCKRENKALRSSPASSPVHRTPHAPLRALKRTMDLTFVKCSLALDCVTVNRQLKSLLS